MIWKRYFLREFSKIFCLVIFSAYFLFVLIDYSTHTKNFHQTGVQIVDILLYYLYQFTMQAEILIVLALLLSTVKVLTTLNIRREIVALAASGISMRKLQTPFLLVALLATLFLYANFQWLEPSATRKLEAFESKYLKDTNSISTHSTYLKDGSVLLYHHFDVETNHLHDLFWVKDLDYIYHIQTLDLKNSTAINVDIIERAKGLHITKSIDKMFFEVNEIDRTNFIPTSLTDIIKSKKWGAKLIYKLIIPWSALLAVCLPAPFCLRFSKQTPTYMLYMLSLFGLIIYFAVAQALLIAFNI